MSDPIRDLFHREAAAIEAAHPDPRTVTSAGRRRLRRRRAITAVVSSVAAVAVAGAAMQVTREGPPPSTGGKRLSVVALVPLASSWSSESRGVGDLAFGFGRLWAFQGGEPTLQSIDPATNQVDSVLSMGHGGNGVFWDVEAAFGRLWVTNPDRPRVLVVDPGSGETTARVDGIPAPLGVHALGDSLWVQSSQRMNEVVYRIDPETLQVEGSLSMGSECCVSGMAEQDGYLWIAHSDVANSARDPGAAHEDAEFDLSNELRKVDPDTMEVLDTIPLPGDTYRPGDTVLGDLAAAGGYLWVSRPEARAVDRVDPVRGTVESLDLREHLRPDGISYFDGDVWVWEINGSLAVPIDPVGFRAGRTSDLGEDVSGRPVEGAGSLWAAVQSGGERPDHVLRVDTDGGPRQEPGPPPAPTPPPRGDLVEPIYEERQAEIFAFRALADTGLMRPFSPRSYNFTFDDVAHVDGEWRIGLAASDCEPKDGTFTCTGLSGEHPRSGNPVTDTYLTVRLDGDRWTVTAAEGNMPQQDRERIVGYSARQEAEPSHWEFPAAAAWATEPGVMVEMFALWVGPYPTEAPGSVCEMTMLDGAGAVVGEPYLFYAEPPNRSFERAGGGRGLGLESVDGPVDHVVVECYQRGDSS